jgi:hypothetical protein
MYSKKRRGQPTGLTKPDLELDSPVSPVGKVAFSDEQGLPVLQSDFETPVRPKKTKKVKIEGKTETPDGEDDCTTKTVDCPKPRATNTEWALHKAKVVKESTELNAVEQIILAKKTYIPSTGKKTSALVVHRQAWILRHPDHGLSDSELKAKIDEDLMAKI